MVPVRFTRSFVLAGVRTTRVVGIDGVPSFTVTSGPALLTSTSVRTFRVLATSTVHANTGSFEALVFVGSASVSGESGWTVAYEISGA